MPVEIRELVIKTTIGKSETPDRPTHPNVSPAHLPQLKEEIIQTCMNQMKVWLKQQNER